MLHGGRWPSILLTLSLLACSPALNWREVRFEPAIPLRMLLPCKPDRATREVDMAGHKLTLQMLGCDADGGTFAVSHVQLADATAAAAVLVGWKSAVLAHVQAQSVQDLPWTPAGAAADLPSLRLQALGRRAGGEGVALQAAWFGVTGPGGVHLFHAVMFSPRPRPDVAEAFFSGLAAAR
ncbi:hypothetical protein [Pseudorhodoferax sp.]|uniref:hypothetical protein n=1 Tax=Pseudorhodoferax sp. TaxID=1993553 RepID=UPI002DD67C1F|nr:hypothetical protein [Pseudorhodoferax sp.]